MKVLFSSFLIAVAVTLSLESVAQTQQWGEVNFNNANLPSTTSHPDRLVWFRGTALVGTNIFAQLFYGTNDQNLIPVTNAPATFRPPTTQSPGTWTRGGMRTLVGILPGTPARLEVRIWDGAWPYEEALSNGSVISLRAFDYTPPSPPASEDAYYMHNFEAPWYLGDCGLFPPPGTAILEQPTNQIASVGETVILSVVATNYCRYSAQWQFNGTNLINGLSGFFPNLRINNVQLHHQGDYRFIVWGGSGRFTSQVARVTVLPPPQLSSARYSDGNFAFHVSEEPGRAVVIETAPDINPATTWTPVLTNTAPFWFTNSTPADRQRFYRTVFR